MQKEPVEVAARILKSTIFSCGENYQFTVNEIFPTERQQAGLATNPQSLRRNLQSVLDVFFKGASAAGSPWLFRQLVDNAFARIRLLMRTIDPTDCGTVLDSISAWANNARIPGTKDAAFTQLHNVLVRYFNEYFREVPI